MSQSTVPLVSPRGPCEPWGFWSSAAWGLAALAGWVGAQFAIAFLIFAWYGAAAPAMVRGQGLAGGLALFVSVASAPAPVLVLALAARLARCRFADYLALKWPSGRDLAIGLACVVILLPAGDLASHLSGRDVVPPFVIDAYKQARDSGALWLLVIAFVIAAPAMEEFIFRGFLLPGFAASRIGLAGALTLTSASWAAMHVQYELFFVVQIFLLGLVFGWLRWRSGSTMLTWLLHALINLSALVQTAIIVAWWP